jgi:hypothetical protein
MIGARNGQPAVGKHGSGERIRALLSLAVPLAVQSTKYVAHRVLVSLGQRFTATLESIFTGWWRDSGNGNLLMIQQPLGRGASTIGRSPKSLDS